MLLPQIVLAIPQYLLLAKVGLTDSYSAVMLPQLFSPYGIYLCRIYAEASVPRRAARGRPGRRRRGVADVHVHRGAG